MKGLLVVTQVVDEQDQLLGFFIPWIRLLASYFEHVEVICMKQGVAKLSENVHITSLGKKQGASRAVQAYRFYRFVWFERSKYDAVLVHMNPIWMVMGGPLWRMMGKQTYLWYTHKAITLKLHLALALSRGVFTASPESFRIASRKVIVTGHGIDSRVRARGFAFCLRR